MKLRILLSSLSLALLMGCATTETVRYTQPSTQPTQKAKQVNLKIYTYLLKEPSPTVIYMHGCSGLDGAYLEWKKRLNDWGYNVVMPDSNSSRGFTSACASQGVANVSHNERLEDLLETAQWVSQQPWQRGKIGVIGYSMGAMATLNMSANGGELLLSQPNGKLAAYENKNISAAVAYYPMCRLGHKNAQIPTLIFVGELDTWTPPIHCKTLADQNKNINLTLYPGVYHSFDTPGFDQVNRHGHRIKYDSKAAQDSIIKTQEFLDKYLKN